MIRPYRLRSLAISHIFCRSIAINVPIYTPSQQDFKLTRQQFESIAVGGFPGGFNKPPSDPDDPKNPKNIIARYYKEFKLFMKRYGWIGVGTYWCIWSGTYASFYCAFESGLVDYHTWQFLHMDLLESYYIKYMGMLGIDADLHPINSKTESLLVAFAAAKITKPIQWCAVFGLTPIISRKLGYAPIPDVTIKEKIKKAVDKMNNKIDN